MSARRASPRRSIIVPRRGRARRHPSLASPLIVAGDSVPLPRAPLALVADAHDYEEGSAAERAAARKLAVLLARRESATVALPPQRAAGGGDAPQFPRCLSELTVQDCRRRSRALVSEIFVGGAVTAYCVEHAGLDAGAKTELMTLLSSVFVEQKKSWGSFVKELLNCRKRSFTLALCANDTVLAAAMVEDDGMVCIIRMMATHPAHRRCGCARLLDALVQQECYVRRKAKHLCVEVSTKQENDVIWRPKLKYTVRALSTRPLSRSRSRSLSLSLSLSLFLPETSLVPTDACFC